MKRGQLKEMKIKGSNTYKSWIRLTLLAFIIVFADVLTYSQCPISAQIKTGNDQCIRYTWNSGEQPTLPDPLVITTATTTLTFDLASSTSTTANYQLQGVTGNP